MQWLDKLLQEGEVYSVGGCVRDELLGRSINDQDLLVSGIAADELEKMLKPLGQLHLVGKSFGVYLFKPHGADLSYEIALPRVEVSTGDSHQAFDVRVDHTLSIETDLKRRDFTINAMAKRLRDGHLIDPWGGQKDLEAQLIRQVFPDTFKEDPLRMLRACQFAARLEFELEPETRSGITNNTSLVSTLSAERIFQELQKLLNAAKPSIGLKMMQATGLMTEVLPELSATVGISQPSQYHRHDVFNHILAVIDAVTVETNINPDPEHASAPTQSKLLDLRWAALCHDLGKPAAMGRHPVEDRPTFYGHEAVSSNLADQLLTRLKAPEALKAKVKILCSEHMFQPVDQLTDRALRRLIHRVGQENILDLLHLRRADMIGSGRPANLSAWEDLLNRTLSTLNGGTFSRNQLAINGQDLIDNLGVEPGPQLGKLLDQLLLKVLDDPALNIHEQLLKLARQLL